MATATLHPYAQEWLDMEQKLGGRSVLKGTVDEQRAQFAGLGAAVGPMLAPLPDVLDVEDVTVNGNLKVRVYSPKEGRGALPLGLYLHAGGWIMGSIDSDDYLCRVISMSSSTVIISVEYRLAPEHKYPAAQEDAMAAFEWATANAKKYGASPSSIFSIGQSAGGNMAVSLALRIRESGDPSRIKGVVALGPPTIAPSAIPSELASQFNPAANADSALIDVAGMEVYTSAYDPPLKSPEFSILLSSKLATLPPVYLVGCGKDPTRDEILVFKNKLEEAGVKTKFDFYEGLPHLFWIIPGLPSGATFVNNLTAGIQWVVKNME